MNKKKSDGQFFRKSKIEQKPILITGGFGFIATNLADRLLSQGLPVHLFDNLSRRGVEANLYWLRSKYGDLVQAEAGDVRDYSAVKRAIDKASAVFHFAAQVAVTKSIEDPIHDFQVNVQGTINVLEAIRASRHRPPLLFTSTNKVYGALPDVSVHKNGLTYEPLDSSVRTRGISEEHSINFYSPYGCSKGAAEQYILDYARTYSVPAAVFRMSCIYGLHQMGNEDQGWVAHFLLKAIQNEPLTIYGDGYQVRDCLFVDDLVDAFLLAQKNIDLISGEAFNIGGGPKNTTSLLQLIHMIEGFINRTIPIDMEPWRCGDQRYYVSDTTKFENLTGWNPRTTIENGVSRLYNWFVESHDFSRAKFFSGKVAI
jgi:CDP-paratose 2-epimerase